MIFLLFFLLKPHSVVRLAHIISITVSSPFSSGRVNLFILFIALFLVLPVVHPPTPEPTHLALCANAVIVSGQPEAY